MNMEPVIQAHGANRGAACAVCKGEVDSKLMEKAITDQTVLYCERAKCAGKKHPVKPNIVFFGEQLPKNFLKIMMDGKL